MRVPVWVFPFAVLIVAGIVFLSREGDTAIEVFALVGLIVMMAGFVLLERSEETAKQIGSSLLTGALLAFALGLVQFWVEDERQDAVATEQIQRQQDAAREQFRLSVGVTRHLEGLDPKAFYPGLELSLQRMQLSGKVLDMANFREVNLREANLQESSLRGAHLQGAQLQGANLFRANLAGAQLQDADFTGADLRFTNMRDARLITVGSLTSTKFRKAKVNHETCWPEWFLFSRSDKDKRIRKNLEKVETEVHGVIQHDASVGQACKLTLDGISKLLARYDRYREFETRSIRQMASILEVLPERIVAKLTRRAPVEEASPSRLPSFVHGLCAGSQVLHVNLRGWSDGFSFLLIQRRGEELLDADVTRSVKTLPKDRVKQLQRGLATAGYDDVVADGIVGPKTDKALDDYRSKPGVEKNHKVQDFLRWRRDIWRFRRTPLRLGDTVKLVGTSAENRDSLEYVLERQVPSC